MAKKATTKKSKSSKSMTRTRRTASIIPAETTLKYRLPGNGSDVYLDLMKDISAVNRRGMNQGQVLRIAGITLKQDSGVSTEALQVTFKTMPLTWVAAQAYMKGRDAWMRQQQRVRKETGQNAIAPAYEDFKIFMDSGMAASTGSPPVFTNILDTLTGDSTVPVVAGEWDYSKLVYAEQPSEALRQPYLHMVGDDVGVTNVGLIKAYEESRATVSPTVPNVPGDASTNIYALLTGGQDEGAAKVVIDNMEDDNDNPPYALNNYPGGDVNYATQVDKCYVQTSSANPVVTTPSFDAMCGLVRIFSQGKDVTNGNDIPVPVTILVHLVSGPKKGLLSMNVGDLV